MGEKNYWGFRIDTTAIDFFKESLDNGYLRQGWGYNEGQNLNNFTVDEGASRNKAMLNVKKGDILIVPRLPDWEQVAIVEATEDWKSGYKFEIIPKVGDYGHMFPAKLIKSFVRDNEHVNASIRSTLKTPSRFWNISKYKDNIEKIISVTSTDDLLKSTEKIDKTESSIRKAFLEVFNEDLFSKKLNAHMDDNFQSAEWEYPLTHGLQSLFPHCQVERVGGKAEEKHGTDILIKMPDIRGESTYAIAIQVKDYEGAVYEKDPIEQISKADTYWAEQENLQLIDKIIIFTKAKRDENPKLNQLAKEKNIKLIMKEEFEKLICQIGKRYLGLQNY